MLHVESLEQEEEISEREGGQIASQRGGRSSLSTRGGSLKDFARYEGVGCEEEIVCVSVYVSVCLCTCVRVSA